ncbi:MAG TPA: TonB family protein [Puia sp.]|nr:TonB family protein [Puia sp.]
MEMNKIPQADLLDIVFDGRNKMYGAYDLRKNYNRRLTKALAMMASLCLLLIGGYVLAGKMDKSARVMPMVDDPTLTEVNMKEKPVEPLPQPKLPAPKVATLAFTIPKITNEPIKPDEMPPAQTDMDDVKIGTANVAGVADDGIVAPPTGDGGKGIVDPPKKPDSSDYVFMSVQIESSYPGGMPAWQRFLLKNFVTPEDALDKGISGTVVVQFIVDKEGNVSDVQAMSGPEELTREAVRVIKKSGKWTPAIQNGRHVNSYKKQPITVQTRTE